MLYMGAGDSNKMTRTAPAAAAVLFALSLSAAPLLAAGSSAPQPTDLTPRFQAAGVHVDKLQVFELGGVVVMRGRSIDRAAAEQAGAIAANLGYTRVANLIQVVDKPDDAVIQRVAERELTIHRSLDGCTFQVASSNGVVHLNGRVQQEAQKDVAIELMRNIEGVRSVEANLQH